MKAVLFPGNRQVRMVERPKPVAGYGQVVIKSRASAICRSDMGLYTGNSAIVGGDIAGKGLVIPGHESAGEIVEVGPGVDHLAVGDRVAVHLAFGCGHCKHCAAGFTMLCKEWKCLGFDVDGANADYVVLPARNALPLPDELSFAAGSVMTDMIGSQFFLQQKLHVSGQKRVAVFGLGPMGSAAVLVAKGLGAEVIAVDILPGRLELALDFGADHIIDSSKEDAVARIMKITNGEGVEVAIDCSGAPAGQNAALDVAAKQGAVSFVGESRKTEINPSDQIIRKLLTVVGGWYFPLGSWSEIVDFVVSRKVPVEKMITHRYALTEADEAFRAFDRRETEKAIFVWNE